MGAYGSDRGMGIDTLRHCYLLVNDDIESYKSSIDWVYTVDSLYALSKLGGKASLDVFLQSLSHSKLGGQGHYGCMFELFVHQLFSQPNMTVIFHVKPYLNPRSTPVKQTNDNVDGLKSYRLDKNTSVKNIGKNDEEAFSYLSTWTMDIWKISYWHPVTTAS